MADYPALLLWTDAYLADTTDLSAEEHGAYLLLLMAAWRTPDCSLPDDDIRLARTARVGVKKWRVIRSVMERFWTVSDGKWTQKRLLAERKRTEMLRSQKSKAGRASALKRNKTSSTNVASPYPTAVQPPSPSPTPKEEEVRTIALTGSSFRQEPQDALDLVPAENNPPKQNPLNAVENALAVHRYNAVAERAGLPLVQKITSQRKSKLQARLKDCGGPDGWDAALAKLEASSFLCGRTDQGFRADLDFILQEKSFTRLMEGFYDDRKNGGSHGGRGPGGSGQSPDEADRKRFADIAAGLGLDRSGS